MAKPQQRESPVAAPLPRGLRLRLTVAIPLAVGFLVMLSGFLTLWISHPLFLQVTRPTSAEEVGQRVGLVFAVVVGFTLLSLLLAIALTGSIVRPLRLLTSRMESLRRASGELPGPPRERTEIAALGSALRSVESSVSTLIRDSYTLHSLESGVVTVDQAGTVTSFNPVAGTILGISAEKAVGRPVSRIVPDEPANAALLASIHAGLADAARASSAEATLRTHGGLSVEIGYSVSPLRDEAGALLGVVLTFKDLGEHKQAELLIRRAENLALLGTMATSVAHEVRNPLAAISGLIELIRDAAPVEAQHREYCERILDAIERINRICQELLTIGNPEPRTVEPLDINELARTTLQMCRFEAANRAVEVHEHYADGLPPVPGDAERLGQVLFNILRNAFQAVREGGEITLATRCAEGAVAVAVHNTGPPIPPEVQGKLFTLFYTTKKRGTGLGLAVSQQLVRAHGGRILVDSGPDQGATFTIELPVAAAAPALAECVGAC